MDRNKKNWSIVFIIRCVEQYTPYTVSDGLTQANVAGGVRDDDGPELVRVAGQHELPARRQQPARGDEAGRLARLRRLVDEQVRHGPLLLSRRQLPIIHIHLLSNNYVEVSLSTDSRDVCQGY
ncbi:unnamed protein product [Arctia plantaginis]|uniref:Uncharacterized protein n=1 Tax=Arctia plantaginis TaxID=874455 RepID=A0A8S1AHY8_ARCPL|nr:unnamed protein product [Arctia plantaginis]